MIRINKYFTVLFIGNMSFFCSSKTNFLGEEKGKNRLENVEAQQTANSAGGDSSSGKQSEVNVTVGKSPRSLEGSSLPSESGGTDTSNDPMINAEDVPNEEVSETGSEGTVGSAEMGQTSSNTNNVLDSGPGVKNSLVKHGQDSKKDTGNVSGNNGKKLSLKGLCAKKFGMSGGERLHVAGSEHDLSLQVDSVLVLKVTGDENVLKVILKASSEEQNKIGGICLFIAGNLNKVNIEVGINTEKIAIIGRGNQAQVDINVAANTKVDQVIANLAGNQPHINVKGEGEFTCLSVKSSGNAPELNCQK